MNYYYLLLLLLRRARSHWNDRILSTIQCTHGHTSGIVKYDNFLLYFEWNRNMYLDLRDVPSGAAEHFVHFKRTIYSCIGAPEFRSNNTFISGKGVEDEEHGKM